MKQGKTLTELAAEIDRQTKCKRDFIVPTSQLLMDGKGCLGFSNGEAHTYGLSDYAHGQVADHLGIPRKYYERMRAGGDTELQLLGTNVNHWMASQGSKRMIRTLDGGCRAYLSSRYRRLDNIDLMEAVLPVLQENRVELASAEVTPQKMYIKALFPKVESEIKPGDVVQSGVVISNSEVGAGIINIQPLVYRLVCSNGMILPDSKFSKYHLGADKGVGVDVAALLSDETKHVSDVAFWMSVRDVLKSTFDIDLFNGNVAKLREAAGMKIESKNLEKVVEVTQKKLALGESVGRSIFENLLSGNDFTRWGLANAITATANTQEDYEAATELEAAGGHIIELSKTDWTSISTAA